MTMADLSKRVFMKAWVGCLLAFNIRTDSRLFQPTVVTQGSMASHNLFPSPKRECCQAGTSGHSRYEAPTGHCGWNRLQLGNMTHCALGLFQADRRFRMEKSQKTTCAEPKLVHYLAASGTRGGAAR